MATFKVKSTEAGWRADVLVAKQYPEFSRSALKGLFDGQFVKSQASTIKPSQRLRSGQTVTVDDSLLNVEPTVIKIPVIYEDKNVVVVNKPAGVLTHNKGALNSEATVADFFSTKIPDSQLSGNRAGIVHRLDRGTSGVIIGAKNATALKWLQKQFSTRKVKKIYLDIVEGRPNPPAAIIDAPIERNPKRPQTFRVGGSGKAAQTKYQTQRTFKKNGKIYSLLELQPTTGRTHQIRVHLAYIKHPIIGDAVYGHVGGNMLLHAASLEITLPNGQRRQFDSPPTEFKKFIKDVRSI